MGEGGGVEPLLLLECRCFFSCFVAAGAGVGPGAAACRQCQEYGPSSICYCPLLLSHADNLPGAQYPGWFPACAAAFPASFTAAADAAELLNLNLSDLACCLLLVLPLLLLVVLLPVLSQISSCICCQETRCLFCNAVAAAIVLLQLLLVALVMVLQLPPLPLLLLLVPNHFASACAALWSCDCIVCLHK